MQNNERNRRIEAVLSKYEKQKEYVLNALHELQDNHPLQYIDEEALDACCVHFKMTKAEVYGIVSYYSMLSLTPRAKYIIRLCQSPVCSMMGQQSVISYLAEKWELKPHKTSADGLFYLEIVECLGRCGKAPSMMINKDFYTGLNPQIMDSILQKLLYI